MLEFDPFVLVRKNQGMLPDDGAGAGGADSFGVAVEGFGKREGGSARRIFFLGVVHLFDLDIFEVGGKKFRRLHAESDADAEVGRKKDRDLFGRLV